MKQYQYFFLDDESLNKIHFSNFNYPHHIYIKNLNQHANIDYSGCIFEPRLLFNPNLTMAIPAFVTLPATQFPK
jgi:hypothetical protein